MVLNVERWEKRPVICYYFKKSSLKSNRNKRKKTRSKSADGNVLHGGMAALDGDGRALEIRMREDVSDRDACRNRCKS